KVVPLEHSGDRVLCGELDQPDRVHLAHPAGVELETRALRIEDLVDLLGVSLRVRLDLLPGQRRPSRRLTARVADHPREVADQEDYVMAVILAAAHLIEEHGMAEMQGRRGRVEAGRDPERAARAG